MRQELRRSLDASSRDIGQALQRLANAETADYVRRHMSGVDSVDSPLALLDKALALVEFDGLHLEFGVFRGGSINHIADRINGTVYGFDSFEGLPERWRDGFGTGRFKVARLPDVRPNVTLVKGWFDETLPRFVKEHPGDVAFLHVDCDLYSSTRIIFDTLGERIRPGSVIVFDEYFNYPGWQEGEIKAFREFLEARGLAYDYLGYNRLHEQVAVRIRQPS